MSGTAKSQAWVARVRQQPATENAAGGNGDRGALFRGAFIAFLCPISGIFAIVSTMLYDVILVLALLLANGVLAMAEIAVLSARKGRLTELADRGQHGARLAIRLAADPSRFLATIQLGLTLLGVLTGVLSGQRIAHNISVLLAPIPGLGDYADGLGIAVVVAVLTYLSLVFGELVPKQLALRNAEDAATFLARPLLLFSKLVHPITRVLAGSSNLILRFFKGSEAPPSAITEEELKVMIDHATEAGVMRESEQDMMKGVLSLGDLTAKDLMTPRHEMVALDVEDDEKTNWARITESGHTYFPVVDGEATNIIGLVSIKHLIEHHLAGRPLALRALAAPPLFLPETVPAVKVMEKFKIGKTHMAFVVDEHGGIEGIITVTDVLKAVVGDMPTMGEDAEEPLIVRREDGSFLVDGRTAISELMVALRIKTLPKKHAGDYTTVGGLIMTRLGRIPNISDSFRFRGYRFEVVDMDKRRVDKVLVTKMPRKLKAGPHPTGARAAAF